MIFCKHGTCQSLTPEEFMFQAINYDRDDVPSVPDGWLESNKKFILEATGQIPKESETDVKIGKKKGGKKKKKKSKKKKVLAPKVSSKFGF